jgi:hypothetical protein
VKSVSSVVVDFTNRRNGLAVVEALEAANRAMKTIGRAVV